MNRLIVLAALLLLCTGAATAHASHGDAGGDAGDATGGTVTDGESATDPALPPDHPRGTVMNPNTDELPPGCDDLRGWRNITVHAGREFADPFPGTVFTYSNRSYDVGRCMKLTVTLANHDAVRHQWMVHGLPRSIHPMGMFSLETTGPDRVTGTFITPAAQDTLLVHCGLPQHEQKGMKAQLKVGGGAGALENVPGITGLHEAYDYPQESPLVPAAILFGTGLLFGLGAVLLYRSYGMDRNTEEPADA